MSGTVLSEDIEEGVRLVTLNRPHRLNAIVPELLEDLIQALRGGQSRRRPSVPSCSPARGAPSAPGTI